MARSVPLPPVAESEPRARPQNLILNLLGIYFPDAEGWLSSRSIVDVLADAGHGEPATRATLARMVRRGLVFRRVDGRRTLFALTPEARGIVEDGRRLVWERDPVNRSWDGSWTSLAFSMPESFQRQRHDLRTRLSRAGFGAVRAGLWISPHDVDLDRVLDGLDLAEHIIVMRGVPSPPTTPEVVVAQAFDLDAVAIRYERFLDRWADVGRAHPASSEILMTNHLLHVLRHDPRLPVEFLPEDWPAETAARLYRTRYAEWHERARQGLLAEPV
nr:PaaX family transcriptional regulator C-terminal domain-containing protein [Microbacterium bovistercoris]